MKKKHILATIVFFIITGVIAGFLAVNGEGGLREAGIIYLGMIGFSGLIYLLLKHFKLLK